MHSSCDRDDGIKWQLPPAGTQRAASLLPPSGSCPILAPVSESETHTHTKRVVFSLSSSRIDFTYVFNACFWFYCLYVSYDSVLSVNSNYPPASLPHIAHMLLSAK